jgi:hypothetical protein
MPFGPKAPPLSYADGPRLQRAIQALAAAEREAFVAAYNEHLATRNILSLQRLGQFLNVVTLVGDVEALTVFDFGQVSKAQACLTALTDCFRSQNAVTRVLMPVASKPM